MPLLLKNWAYRKSGKIGQYAIWGLMGSAGPFLLTSSKNRVAQKLRSFILVHCGLIRFRIHFRKARNPHFLFCGHVRHDHDSRTNYTYFWGHRSISKKRETPKHVRGRLCLETQKVCNISKDIGKDRSRQIPKIRLINS